MLTFCKENILMSLKNTYYVMHEVGDFREFQTKVKNDLKSPIMEKRKIKERCTWMTFINWMDVTFS